MSRADLVSDPALTGHGPQRNGWYIGPPMGPDETFGEYVARKAREYFEPGGPMFQTRIDIERDIMDMLTDKPKRASTERLRTLFAKSPRWRRWIRWWFSRAF